MYKPTDVFLDASDSAKIAPYIPKALLDGWEWWYQMYWINDDKSPRYEFRNISDLEEGARIIPALDVGILGILFSCLKPKCKRLWLEGDGSACVGGDFCEGYRRYKRGTELQNRRDALMYLIDQKLIGPVEGREE